VTLVSTYSVYPFSVANRKWSRKIDLNRANLILWGKGMEYMAKQYRRSGVVWRVGKEERVEVVREYSSRRRGHVRYKAVL
jgi:hypothetical protein